ncbi:beta-ketoacyl synthase chain length factor [Gilvimarinus sp. SDUM040013]|uniref:Beta-ketoacyl synthase chain length factor n=1 Tax=Gilvimarinus gilvus TaxID=3058038 RepID=A0ABU4S3H4_9GAMM|nr:beta-ketoacyl synthase chain length factor [Gilvimarinus sp. SDUM040013]MDO3387800.1 beta-ketoacyl synthase chain length factor [Gilvimarinus sp. SDUM040013]MDX6851057.1 beta-ketoacyl synthase chain length factor [Gilvimarinus sp. SDUM040013]
MQVWVSQLHAWAPGLSTGADWQGFCADELPLGDDKPAAGGVPAMTRRRLTRWGRQAMEVAEPLAPALTEQTPVIFSSRHGDTARTFKLLRDLASGEPLSPNAFSLSVHNSALGLFTILKDIHTPSLALAAGSDTLAAAWQEACSWLATGREQVLLVHTDEPLADFYQPYRDELDMPAAVGILLHRAPTAGADAVELTMAQAQGPRSRHSMMINFLAGWFGHKARFTHASASHQWCWARVAAHG